MNDAKQYARKLMVVNLSDKSNDEKKKEEETVKIDPVCGSTVEHGYSEFLGTQIISSLYPFFTIYLYHWNEERLFGGNLDFTPYNTSLYQSSL